MLASMDSMEVPIDSMLASMEALNRLIHVILFTNIIRVEYYIKNQHNEFYTLL